MTVFARQGDGFGRKVTLSPPKVTVLAGFAAGPCQTRQHPRRSRKPLAPRAAFRKSASP
jgi:hypothetical protein